jgi:CheY-specific phosphatase CheX
MSWKISSSSFATIMQRSLRKNLNLSSVLSIKPNDHTQRFDGVKNDLVIMTISSLRFKVSIFFVFPIDPRVQAHIGSIFTSGSTPSDADATFDRSTILDQYCEIANMICGQMNRELCKSFRFSGLSTPIAIDGTEMTEHVDKLRPNQRFDLDVAIADGVEFSVIGCVFVSDPSILNFLLAESLEDENNSGELELF